MELKFKTGFYLKNTILTNGCHATDGVHETSWSLKVYHYDGMPFSASCHVKNGIKTYLYSYIQWKNVRIKDGYRQSKLHVMKLMHIKKIECHIREAHAYSNDI